MELRELPSRSTVPHRTEPVQEKCVYSNKNQRPSNLCSLKPVPATLRLCQIGIGIDPQQQKLPERYTCAVATTPLLSGIYALYPISG
jgi:hypothetical protein